MSFTTLSFGLLLALVFAIHWRMPGRAGQNAVLVVASYVFYGWWDPRFCGLLLVSSLVDFGVARGLARTPSAQAAHDRRRRRGLLAISCVFNLGLLALFKYYGFFVAGFVELAASLGLTAHPPSLQLVLPVGISFYTFQTLGYAIDVYRGDAEACDSLLDYLTYVALFPQLVAGPIERARRLLPQLQRPRVFDEARARDGAKQMLWGLAKKIAIADHLGEFVDSIYASPIVHAPGPVLMVATIAFAFQIYCDFSAYSDIAIGSARLLGLDLVRNFATPYFSRSVAEFWRRWHMSLSTWFRDYVYVPLGGSRRGPARRWLALMATFSLSGLWHGASWTFVIWGAVNGLLVGLTTSFGRGRARLGPDDPPPGLTRAAGLRAAAAMLATFASICATWVLFRAVDLAQAMGIYARIAADLVSAPAWRALAHHAEFLAAFGPLVLTLVAVEWVTRDRPHPLELSRWPRPLRWLIYTLLVWATLYLMPEDPGAFIYFQF